MDFKTNQIKVKKSVSVGTISVEVMEADPNLSRNNIKIQNTGTTELFVSFGEVATEATNGELLLGVNESIDTKFQGSIYAIRSSVVFDERDTCTVLVV